MNSHVFPQFAIGLAFLVTGLSGWLVPFTWRQKNQPPQAWPNTSWFGISELVGILLAIFGAVVLLRPLLVGKVDPNGGVIADNQVVTLEFDMYDEKGNLLETSKRQGPLTYLYGIGELPSGLERELEGKQAGDEVMVTLPPDDAYGHYNASLVQAVPRDQFETTDELAVGTRFEGDTSDGPRVVRVVGLEGEDVIVDANEPYAGYTVRFEVKVLNVRPASPEEIKSGQVAVSKDF